MADTKKWFEVLLTPLAVALVGVVGTCSITTYQARHSEKMIETHINSAEKLAAAQIRSAELRAKGDQGIKALEIFSQKIFSEAEEDQVFAVKLLRAVAPEIGGTIASAIADLKEGNIAVQKEAIRVAMEATQAEINDLISRLASSERRKASNQLIRIYENGNEDTQAQVIKALIAALLPERDPWSYRVNIYVARTLGRLTPNWTASLDQINRIKMLQKSASYKDPTFKDRVNEALKNAKQKQK